MNDSKVKKLPKECFDLYQRYINTPYYINKSKNKFLSSINLGKANPDEIDQFIKDNNNNKLLKGEKRYKFLEERRVGIDCSGFVTNIMDIVAIKNKDKHIWELIVKKSKNPIKILYSHRVRPITSKMNADTLTNDDNSIAIKKVKDIKPGDLIRMNGGQHVAIISELNYNKAVLSKIVYWQSTENVGVCTSEIIVKNQNKDLIDQDWKTIKGAKYQPLYLYKKKINSNGVRRLKLL